MNPVWKRCDERQDLRNQACVQEHTEPCRYPRQQELGVAPKPHASYARASGSARC